ncbi:MAG: lactonase family protein [Acidobacteriaceae bacterium]|jgi:6-phosphogluconolactonase
MNRRRFLAASAISAAAARSWIAQGEAKTKRRLLLVGTQTHENSKGIYAYNWDPASGELRGGELAAASDNPTFLALDPAANYLYAANELNEFEGQKSGAVSAFAVDRAAGKLRPINQVASLGAGTCNVSVDAIGRAAFCANYVGGSASSFFLHADGQISSAVSHFQYTGHGPNAERQEGPHAHRVTVSPDNRWLLVNDLGLDKIHIYHLNPTNAKLTPNQPAAWDAAPGSGPRALVFHPNGHIAYCVCEMGSVVNVLRWDSQKGTLHELQTISLVPEDYHGQTAGCDIALTRDGRFAYAINRFYDSAESFSVAKDGKLTLLARSSCGGKTPRHLTLDPTERFLLVANQDSDNIGVFARDAKTGKLAETGRSYPRVKPQCLVFA